jgi:hypothetical protein
MLRAGLLALGLALPSVDHAMAQDGDWNIFKPPWEQARQMLCTEMRRDHCTLLGSCGPSHGSAKLTFDFESNRIEFGGLNNRGLIPDIRITGRTFYVLSKVNPTMALLVGDGRLLKLQYRLNDPKRGQVVLDADGRLVARSKEGAVAVEPRAQLLGFMVGYDRWDLIQKEDTIEVMRFECVKKEPGLLDFLRR